MVSTQASPFRGPAKVSVFLKAKQPVECPEYTILPTTRQHNDCPHCSIYTHYQTGLTDPEAKTTGTGSGTEAQDETVLAKLRSQLSVLGLGQEQKHRRAEHVMYSGTLLHLLDQGAAMYCDKAWHVGIFSQTTSLRSTSLDGLNP